MKLNRDNFKCTNCGADDMELHVHHKYYLNGKDIWDYPDNALITYCFKCHEEEEKNLKEVSEEIENLRYNTALAKDRKSGV